MPLFRTYKVLFISRIMKDKLSHKSKLSKSIGKKMTFLFPLTVAGLFANFGHSLQQMHESLLHIHPVFLTMLFRSCDLPGPCCMSCWPGLSQDSISWRCGVSVSLWLWLCVYLCVCLFVCVFIPSENLSTGSMCLCVCVCLCMLLRLSSEKKFTGCLYVRVILCVMCEVSLSLCLFNILYKIS